MLSLHHPSPHFGLFWRRGGGGDRKAPPSPLQTLLQQEVFLMVTYVQVAMALKAVETAYKLVKQYERENSKRSGYRRVRKGKR